MFGVIIGFLAGLMGGLIAFALWSLLPDTWRAARVPVAIVVAILAGLALSRVEPPTPPERSFQTELEVRLVNSERVGPIARAFRENDPTEFARFIRGGDIYGRGEGEEAAAHRAETALIVIGRSRFIYLSDADMARRYILWRDEMLALSETDPARCYTMYRGTVPVADLLFVGHDDLNRREIEIFEAAFTAEPRSHEPVSDEDYAARLEEIDRAAMTFVGDDILLLAPGAPIVGNEARFCQVAAEVFNQMAQTPELARLHAAAEARGRREAR